MKNKILLGVVFILILTIIFLPKEIKKASVSEEKVDVKESQIFVRLLDEQTNTITEENLEDYIVGVVSAEMPSVFNMEALKAQAVAARTYAMYKKKTRNLDYDLIIGVKDQAYKNNETLLKYWGINFFSNYLKIREAVKETKGQVLTYQNNIINAFYFSMSNGYTENSELVFQEKLPYLNSVTSFWDNENLQNFAYTTTFSKNDFCTSLNISCDVLKIGDITRSDTHRVLKITINDKTFKGTEFRSKLGLRSTDFEISLENENVTITTKGYGHGVGMSQYGANGMAKEGYSYQEILAHYYQNTELKNIYA